MRATFQVWLAEHVLIKFFPGMMQFLTGLWGMNFDTDLGNMPELEWEHGYKMFW